MVDWVIGDWYGLILAVEEGKSFFFFPLISYHFPLKDVQR
jgi:hypothetical protein